MVVRDLHEQVVHNMSSFFKGRKSLVSLSVLFCWGKRKRGYQCCGE
jgi:hypothetical protein